MTKKLSGQQCALVLAHRNIPHAAVAEVSNRRLGDDSPLYHDLASAATEGLCYAATRYDPERGMKFSTFAYRTCKAFVIDEWRRIGERNRRGRLRAVAVSDATIEKLVGSAEDPAYEAVEYGPAFYAVARLPARERFVFTMYHVEGMKEREIGEVLGISESRISQILSKTQRKLQARLDLAA